MPRRWRPARGPGAAPDAVAHDVAGHPISSAGLGPEKDKREEQAMGARRSGIVFAAALSAAVSWVAGPGASLVAAATGGGECQLVGVANLSPPLGSAAGPFAYN